MKEPWMKHALVYYGKVTAWIIVPALGALFCAKQFAVSDNPLMLTVLIVASFALTIFGIMRSIRSYKQTIK